MIQFCGKAIVEEFLEEGVYSDDSKKSNVVPIYNKK